MSLDFDNVALDYPAAAGEGSLRALEGLSLSIPRGQAVAIIGPSGCGKSSLLRLASGLMQPSSGQVLEGGQPLRSTREGTALILQDFGLLPWKDV